MDTRHATAGMTHASAQYGIAAICGSRVMRITRWWAVNPRKFGKLSVLGTSRRLSENALEAAFQRNDNSDCMVLNLAARVSSATQCLKCSIFCLYCRRSDWTRVSNYHVRPLSAPTNRADPTQSIVHVRQRCVLRCICYLFSCFSQAQTTRPAPVRGGRGSHTHLGGKFPVVEESGGWWRAKLYVFRLDKWGVPILATGSANREEVRWILHV